MIFSKIYKFDTTQLNLVGISKIRILMPWIVCIGLGFSGGLGYMLCSNHEKKIAAPEYEELVVLINAHENTLMSPMAIYKYMKEIGIKYPEIVWSQVVVETGFSSSISVENHNFFGMKRAACRPNVQTGVNSGHATYDNWKMSVIDYAIWQSSTGVWKLKTEAAYFNYLDQRYAEGANYALKVKEIRDNFEVYLNRYEKRYREGHLK